MKFCSSCKQQLDKKLFRTRKASKDGLNASCNLCINTARRLRYAEDPVLRAQCIERSKLTRKRLPIEERQRRGKTDYARHKEAYIARAKHNIQKRKQDPVYRNIVNVNSYLRKLNRVPPWVELLDFYELYALCHARGIDKYVVDHIIPIKGALVSGLHVPSNLQILTHEENNKKSNKVHTH